MLSQTMLLIMVVIREGALQGDDVKHVAAVHSRESVSRSERAPALGGDSLPVRAADAQRGDGTLEAGPARQPHDRRTSRQHQRRRTETPPTRRTGPPLVKAKFHYAS